MDFTQYKVLVGEELLREARDAWGYRAERFLSDRVTFKSALNSALEGNPVRDMITALSQTTEFGLKPLDSIFSRPSSSDRSLEDITMSAPENSIVVRKDSPPTDNKIEYGERAKDLSYAQKKLKSSYRSRGLPHLPVAHYATNTLRAINRQDWARAITFYQKLRQLDGRLFYDADLYSRLLEELGIVILQRNHNYRFYWIKDPGGQFITGYEVKKPKERIRTVTKSSDIENNNDKTEYVNSSVGGRFKKHQTERNRINSNRPKLRIIRKINPPALREISKWK